MDSIFKPIKKISDRQLHAKFRLLRDDPCLEHERRILEQWVEGLDDRDNKMIQEFQKTFHASFWEFYLHACFREAGFALDQGHNRPDFMLKGPYEINVEAVVSNIKDHGRPESDRALEDLMDMFIPPKNQQDFHQVQQEAVIRQSNAVISKIKKYENEYSKCVWVKQDTPFMIAMSSYSQINYGREYIYPMMTLLYGLSYMPNTDSYIPVTEIKKPGTDCTIPVGLFTSDKYSGISAILYSCTTTLGKLTALSKSQGNFSLNEVYNLRRDYEDARIPYKLHKVNNNQPELLTDGLFLFHNPYAKNKIDIKCFEGTNITQFFYKEGELIHTSNTFPIVCRLNISKLLEPGFLMLITEYVRQYNNFSPMEFYSLDPSKKITVDFDRNCLICIWIKMKTDQSLRNIHYTRPQGCSDKHLQNEAVRIVKERREDNEEIMSISIIREQSAFDTLNQ